MAQKYDCHPLFTYERFRVPCSLEARVVDLLVDKKRETRRKAHVINERSIAITERGGNGVEGRRRQVMQLQKPVPTFPSFLQPRYPPHPHPPPPAP